MNAWTEQLLKLANIEVVIDPVTGSTKFEFISVSTDVKEGKSITNSAGMGHVPNAGTHSANSLAGGESDNNANDANNSTPPRRNRKSRSHTGRRKKERSCSETEANLTSSISPTSSSKACASMLSADSANAAKDATPDPNPSPTSEGVAAGASSDQQTTISWGSVDEVCFPVQVAESAVPTNGYYPLGMAYSGESSSSSSGKSTCSVAEHVTRRQAELLTRVRALPPSLLINLPYCAAVRSSSSSSSDVVFETRQYDYKNGRKNPLFESISEDRRIAILTSNSSSSSSHNHPDASVETFDHLKEVNKAIRAIQDSRDKVGCSCKPLKVDKLSIAKMRSEVHTHLAAFPDLQKRDIEGLSKADLAARVRELYKGRCLCSDQACECSADGVSCNDQSCACMGKGSRLCANPSGAHAYDLDKVDLYRKNLISVVSSTNLRTDSKRSHSIIH